MSRKNRYNDPVFKAGKKVIRRTLRALASSPPPHPDTVHRLRVCTKKLRALLQLYRPRHTSAAIKAVELDVKRIADLYAGSRDAHVLLATLRQLNADNAIEPVLQYFSTQNTERQNALPDTDLPAIFANILERWQRELAAPGGTAFSSGLEYSYSRTRKLARKATTSKDDQRYHACRKWLKYYFYQLGLSGLDKNKGAARHRRQVGVLAERLGLLHDRCVVEAALVGLQQTEDNIDADLRAACELALQRCRDQKQRDKQFCDRKFKRILSRRHSPLLS